MPFFSSGPDDITISITIFLISLGIGSPLTFPTTSSSLRPLFRNSSRTGLNNASSPYSVKPLTIIANTPRSAIPPTIPKGPPSAASPVVKAAAPAKPEAEVTTKRTRPGTPSPAIVLMSWLKKESFFMAKNVRSACDNVDGCAEVNLDHQINFPVYQLFRRLGPRIMSEGTGPCSYIKY